jgi:hypothetical protein
MHKKFDIVAVEDFHLLVDLEAQSDSLKKDDPILFTPSTGEREIYFYDSCDGYGMGVYDINNQRCTISYSRTCKILGVLDKEIEGVPNVSINKDIKN